LNSKNKLSAKFSNISSPGRYALDYSCLVPQIRNMPHEMKFLYMNLERTKGKDMQMRGRRYQTVWSDT
jgi:hypothetical protein